MEYRRFGRTDWKVSEVGYGMWGMPVGPPLTISNQRSLWIWPWNAASISLIRLGAMEKGIANVYWVHWQNGTQIPKSIGRVRYHQKISKWPAKPSYTLEASYPREHIMEYTHKTLKNLGTEQIELLQFHTWDDGWSHKEEWQRAVEDLKTSGKIAAMGVSVNRWEPENGIQALGTGLLDSVQVIYNIFDQAPEDRLFPFCKELDVAVIARVPFDEGTLTGAITKDTKFPEDDWRSTYFVPENLKASAKRADALKPLVPTNMTMAEMALRFILHNKDVAR